MIVEQRADGEVHTEATVKILVDGERRVQIAEGNGPVNALDRALRAAIGEVHPHLADIELVNFKVRILDENKGTGAVTRVLLDASDGDERVGLDRRLGERRRGLLEGARRLARARHAARAAARERQEEIPLARPVLGEAEEERACSRCCAPGGSRSARCWASSRSASRRAVGAPLASAVSSGTAGLHLALRAVGVRDGDEVITSPLSFVASANVIVYERARPVFVDVDPRTLTIDVDGGGGGGDRRARRRCCRSTSSAGPPTCRRSSGSGCRSSRTPARRSARASPTACRSARAATRRCSPSTPTSR